MKHIAILTLVFIQSICAIAQQVGSKVSFQAVDYKMYTGTITEVKGNQYKVKYDGSNFEAWLTNNQFTVTDLKKTSKELRVKIIADDDNTTIPEATVYAEGNTFAGLYSGTSDQSGLAIVTIKSGGNFTISVSHPKFHSAQQIIKITQYGDQQTYALDFRLKRKKTVDKPSNTLSVFVKDVTNKPVQGASIVVLPGVSAVTNSSGYAKTIHRQQPGEYIEVRVSANGYIDQQQRILVGTGQGNAITRPVDVARFVLQKGDNDRNVLNLVIEVLDDNSYQPVNGAAVKVELSDGTSFSGSTNNKGEAKFTDMDYGFQGTTARVIVTHKDYKEKWSDIPGELMMAKDMDERKFLVSVSKSNASWAGEWAYTDDRGTMTINGSGSAVSGSSNYAISDWKATNVFKGCRETATNKITCDFTGAYEDTDKFVDIAGTVGMTLAGNSISVAWKEVGPPKIKWKPGRPQYDVAYIWSDGKVFPANFKRK